MLTEETDGQGEEALPAGDANNLGHRLETKIKDRYKAADAIIEEEEHGALDEYGEELVFDEGEEDEDEGMEEEKDENLAAKEEKTSESIILLEEEDEVEDDSHVMSKDFKMEELIKEQYRARLSSLLKERKEPEESKSFVVIEDDE